MIRPHRVTSRAQTTQLHIGRCGLATEERLVVAHDQNARDQYIDWWVYEECGYERPH
jgi:hypothetical protein